MVAWEARELKERNDPGLHPRRTVRDFIIIYLILTLIF
jgi:hypothetical protein